MNYPDKPEHWVQLSADFIAAMIAFSAPKPKPEPKAKAKAK